MALPKFVDEEIKASMARNEIENGIFCFRLLHKIDKSYTEKFTCFDYYETNKLSFNDVFTQLSFYMKVVSNLSDEITQKRMLFGT